MDNKNTDNKEAFNYTYSAKERSEIMSIRKKYTVSEEKEDKMVRLRRLDRRATDKATVAALVFGIIGALIMGTGMSLTMTGLGTALGISHGASIAIGVAVGIVGIILVVLAYPLYNLVFRKERDRIAPEILRLTDELMK